MRRHLTIRVESACSEDWLAMRPHGDGRHCDRCASTVIDLTRVTRAQAESIVRGKGGAVCGRVRADAKGDAVFAPEPVRRGLMPIALATLLAACAPETPVAPAPHVEVERTGPALPTTGTFGGSLATGTVMPIGPADRPIATEESGPSAEQIALTRRKHHLQHTPAITRPMMGAIRMSP